MSNIISQHKLPSPTEVVWDWKHSEINSKESRAKMRKRGILPITITFLLASLFRFYLGWIHPSTVLYSICLVFIFLTLFTPSWLVAIEKAMLIFGKWVGVLLTWILLVPFFYVVFIPLRLIQMISGGDPMKSKYDPEASSYWIDRVKEGKPSNIENQY